MNKAQIIATATEVVYANVEVSAGEMVEADKKAIQAAMEIINADIATMAEDEIPENYQIIRGAALIAMLEEETPNGHEDITIKANGKSSPLLNQLFVQGKGELQLKVIVLLKGTDVITVMERFLKVDQYEKHKTGDLFYENDVGSISVDIKTYPLIEAPAAIYLNIDLSSVDEKRLDDVIHHIGLHWAKFSTAKIFLEKDNDGRSDTFPVWEIVNNHGVFEKGRQTTLTMGD